jgi:predicted Rossmann-fold nucleotide-binding protein
MDLCIPSGPAVAPSHSLVIAAGGGRDLAWPQQRVAAELLARSGGRLVHLLLHGGARGADAAIGRAAQQLGWSALVMPAKWQIHGRAAGPIRNRELLEQAVARAVAHSSPGCLTSVLIVAFPGGAGTASLVREARRMASRSPVPISVAEVSAAAGLRAVPVGVGCS